MSFYNCLRCPQRAGVTKLLKLKCRSYSVPARAQNATPKSQTPTPKSSCPADTVLTGLNYLKNQPPVLALPDEEYPPWLWTILKPKELEDDGPGGRKERLERRRENKQRIRERNFMSTQ